MKKFFKIILSLWEKSVVKLNKWDYIPNSKRKILYIAPHIYQGKKIKIADGTIISKGDHLAEIHVDNLKTTSLQNNFKNIFKVFEDELIALTEAINNDDSFSRIKAYHGSTVFDPILRRRGFTIMEFENGPKKMFLKIWINILRIVFRKDKLRNNNYLRIPKEFWISREHLLKDYSNKRGEIDE